MNKLTICMMAKSEIVAQTCACFLSLINDPVLSSYSIAPNFAIGQSDLPKARSEQVSNWYIESKRGDLFMFIDSDQTFQSQDIQKCLEYMRYNDIVCGGYAKKSGGITLEPKKARSFYSNKQGELVFGATGFMMFSYNIVHEMIRVGKLEKVRVSATNKAYPLFFERIVEVYGQELWLSEDYSFCWLAREAKGQIYGFISDTIGHVIPIDKRITFPGGKKWELGTIVIYCGVTKEKWNGNSAGLGGSELAVIKLSKEWTKKGYTVYVYCSCNETGVFDGVIYRDSVELNILDEFDIFIGWRAIEYLQKVDIKANRVILDLHDVVDKDLVTQSLIDNINYVCVKSKFHSNMIADIPSEKIRIIPNGGLETLEIPKKDPNYIIYASSYDRGLAYMLKWGWPKIKKECPDAYLHIYYGWNTYDLLRGPDEQLYKNIVLELMDQPGVKEMGRISREELLVEKSKANVHYYVGDFQEIDCISVRESASVGAIPVVSDFAEVFREKPYCTKVVGDPTKKETQELGADIVISLIQDEKRAEEIRNNLTVSKSETWEAVASHWMILFQ